MVLGGSTYSLQTAFKDDGLNSGYTKLPNELFGLITE